MIKKYNEALPFGRVTNVVGYAVDPNKLPDPMPGAEWKEDISFHESEALVHDPSIKQVFEVVREKGATTVTRLI